VADEIKALPHVPFGMAPNEKAMAPEAKAMAPVTKAAAPEAKARPLK